MIYLLVLKKDYPSFYLWGRRRLEIGEQQQNISEYPYKRKQTGVYI